MRRREENQRQGGKIIKGYGIIYTPGKFWFLFKLNSFNNINNNNNNNNNNKNENKNNNQNNNNNDNIDYESDLKKGFNAI